VNFFFDNNISWRYAEAIEILSRGGQDVVMHIKNDVRFSMNNNEWGSNSTRDEVWIQELGRENVRWNLISGNHRILTNGVQRSLLAETSMTFFFPDEYFANATFFEQARKLIWLWPEIRLHSENPIPSVYKIATGPRKTLKIEPVRFGRKSLNDIRE